MVSSSTALLASRRRFSRWAAPLASLIVTMACAQFAAAQSPPAQPSASTVESARNLMDIGYEKLNKEDFKGALDAFRAADAIMRVTSTGLAVGRALTKLNRLLEARNVFLAVARLPQAPNESAPLRRARKDAETLHQKLATQIPSLQLKIKLPDGADGFVVTIDGSPVPDALIGQPQKMDPGQHVVELKVAGYKTKRRTVDLAIAKQVAITLAISEAAGDTDLDSGSSAGGGLSKMSWIGFGIAGAGVIAGSVTGGLALSKASDAKEGCEDAGGKLRCPIENKEQKKADADKSLMLSHISTTSFAIAGAGAVIGIVGILLPRAQDDVDSSAKQSRVVVQPVIGLGSIGLRGRF